MFAVYLDDPDLSNLCSPFDACYIILYADDILIISPSVTNLERLLHRCEHELAWLDMSINLKKSPCLRVGPRCDATCAVITSSTGRSLPWVEEVRYLGVHFVKSWSLKCSFDEPLMLFLEKIGMVASEEVVFGSN